MLTKIIAASEPQSRKPSPSREHSRKSSKAGIEVLSKAPGKENLDKRDRRDKEGKHDRRKSGAEDKESELKLREKIEQSLMALRQSCRDKSPHSKKAIAASVRVSQHGSKKSSCWSSIQNSKQNSRQPSRPQSR